MLAGFLVLLLTLAIALLAGGGAGDVRVASTTTGDTTASTDLAMNQGETLSETGGVADTTGGALVAPPLAATVVIPPVVAPANVGGEWAGAANGDAILPTYRILTYYGHPHDANMGILGEHAMADLRELLLAEAANYEAADPSRPVIPAFELIATVAQDRPGSDGTYILDTDIDTLTAYADYAAANDMLIFLDLQIGHGSVAADIEKVRPLLEQPHVHLALDPEFAMAEGEIPGDHIGSLHADSIVYAQETLAQIVAEFDLPPKILIVHQFREDMIQDKDLLAPIDGVQLVIDADGFGVPELKTEVYNILVRDYLERDPLVAFAGIKLFYTQDDPLMTAAEILRLNPSPDLIIYQ